MKIQTDAFLSLFLAFYISMYWSVNPILFRLILSKCANFDALHPEDNNCNPGISFLHTLYPYTDFFELNILYPNSP